MTRSLAKLAVVATTTLALLLTPTAPAFSAPADPNVIKTLRQPDGSALRVHLWGDEFLHGYETTDGYTIAFDPKDKTYKYAERVANGRLKPSKVKAKAKGGPSGARHLRPSSAAWRDARRSAGAPTTAAFASSPGAAGAAGAAAASAPGWAGADTDLLFLVVEFTDTGCTFTPAQMQTNMFGGGATGPGDLDDYFNEISYGKLKVVGNVVGNQAGTDCIALANNRAYYNTGAANRDDDVVREAVNAANAYTNFADYDNDNDGTVDALGIIFAGGGPHDGCATDASPSGSDGDNLWPHSGGVDTGGALTADGKTIRPFIINSEVTYAISATSNCNQIQTIGLFAHELGHSLGLPDLYDTDVGTGGVGTWSTMASQYVSTTNNADTPPHYDPWSKAFLSWVTPTVHQPADRVTPGMVQVETSPGEVHQFRDNPGGFQIGGPGEYFLVENRQKTGFDKGLAGCGLLVWHIDETQTGNQNGGHTAGSHRLVDVDEADGNADLDANKVADAGDPFPGSSSNRLFADSTNPSSKLYDGTSSNLRMWVQNPTCGSSMSAAFGPNQVPSASAGGPYTTNEGTNANLTAAGSSDPDGDPLTYEWDLDNDGDYDDSTSQTPTFTNVGDNGVFTVKVKVSDNFGDSNTASTTVTVNNVRPTVTALTNTGPSAENTTVSISGAASDPGWLDTLTATVDWGDGAGLHPLPGTLENDRPDATLAFSTTHTYGDNGTYTVTVCASDDDGGTSDPCRTTDVSITNVNPTATIDESGTVSFNGVPTAIFRADSAGSLTGNSTDPGSDDLTLTWLWADGSPDTATKYFVNPPLADPLKSPSIQPRDVTDTQSHAFTACVYDVGFKSEDDDTGTSPTDTVKVLVTGAADAGRQSGYWAHQYRLNGKADFDVKTLNCYLQIAGFTSKVFNEERDVSTVNKAQKLLFSSGNSVSKLDQLDRDLLTAWLNFANGAVGYAELVDTDGNGSKDTQFHTAVEDAEAVRLNPASTPAELDAQRAIINRINDTI